MAADRAWMTAKLQVCTADPSWQKQGLAEALRLQERLAPWLIGHVEHVGSTAVPHLDAKPILDLQAAVADLACVAEFQDLLASSGWHFVPPELDARPWRRFFVQVRDGSRVAHLHVMRPDATRWAEQLAFRDALRGDAALAIRYGELKRSLASQYADDREGYSGAKASFVRTVLNGQELMG
jgi:GrpB-like predicted nucleotidyltransferase (UPF0157 family)